MACPASLAALTYDIRFDHARLRWSICLRIGNRIVAVRWSLTEDAAYAYAFDQGHTTPYGLELA